MIGKTVSHYRIVRQLGAGGMGVVYEAVDTNLDRSVALKFLPPELTGNTQAKARFIHEAKAASALDHVNVCTVYEIDETPDGQMFLAMACYEGETLKDRIARGPLPLDEAMDITRQVAEGLAKAHEREIVHRDIKPANLFVTSDGLVKILDFGLAKLEGQTKITRTGTTLGTASYMSPEQARGGETDARSDLWCLGVVLYEMVTGRVPFQGENAQAVIYGIITSEPPALSGLRSGILPDLEHIIADCLAKEPGERYQQAEGLLTDLGVLQRSVDEGTAETVAIQPFVRAKARRWPWIVSSALLAVLISVAVLIVLPGLRNTPRTGSGANWILVAEFEGPDQDTELAEAARELIVASLEQSGLVTPISDIDLRRGMEMAGLSDTTVVSGPVARELAHRAAAGSYVTGRVDRLPGGYAFILRVRDAETNDLVVALHDRAENDDEFIETLNRLGRELRKKLGESRISVIASRQRLDAITPSYEAYRALVRGSSLLREGNTYAALVEAKRALRIDPDFASAWRLAAICYGNSGRPDSARWAVKEALARPERLTERQVRSSEIFIRGILDQDLDGTLEPARRMVEIDPSAVNYHYLGMIHWLAGDFEAAAAAFTTTLSASAFSPGFSAFANLTAVLITLGRLEEAESYFTDLPPRWQQHRQLDLDLAGNDWDAAVRHARQYVEDDEVGSSIWLISSAVLASNELRRGSVGRAAAILTVCGTNSYGSYEPVLEFAEDRVYLASGRASHFRPEPLAPDTTMAGLVLAGLRATSLGNVAEAEELHRRARARPVRDRNRYGTDLKYLEATLARERQDWGRVLELLDPLTYRGRIPVFVGRIPIRFLVAEAHENLEHAESAAESYAAVLDPTWVSEFGASLELALKGIECSFALHRCARMLDLAGHGKEAARRYEEFLDLVTDPDPEFAHLVTESRVALKRLRGE